ncbi:hypothetical protein H2199_005448 [Coniosporium tulheliwenetii]|uniref:Uncharacterized protein n=1 Tax=Coniosporium tulheliwenetii TaxID=3383036 RepID=A0ACC2Z189_9PEZI|nr:hypothetical protein H2199_005448 [Cladosporium sp. JES 115]
MDELPETYATSERCRKRKRDGMQTDSSEEGISKSLATGDSDQERHPIRICERMQSNGETEPISNYENMAKSAAASDPSSLIIDAPSLSPPTFQDHREPPNPAYFPPNSSLSLETDQDQDQHQFRSGTSPDSTDWYIASLPVNGAHDPQWDAYQFIDDFPVSTLYSSTRDSDPPLYEDLHEPQWERPVQAYDHNATYSPNSALSIEASSADSSYIMPDQQPGYQTESPAEGYRTLDSESVLMGLQISPVERHNLAASPKPEAESCSALGNQLSFPEDWSGRGSHVEFSKDDTIPLSRGRWLGRGLNGDVYETSCKGIAVAWKTIHCRCGIRPEERKEIEVLKKLSHKHIIKLVGTYAYRQFLGLLLWPVATCDLATLLEDMEALHHWDFVQVEDEKIDTIIRRATAVGLEIPFNATFETFEVPMPWSIFIANAFATRI